MLLRFIFLLLCGLVGVAPAAEIGLGPVPASASTSGDSSLLEGKTWEAPGAIGSTTPNTGAFTSITLSTTPLAITSGGTGAASAAAARTALGLGTVATLAAGGASGAATLDSSTLLTYAQLPTAHRMVASDCSAHSVVTGTGETVLKTFSFTAANLPTIAANSNIVIRTLWSCTASTNNKTMKVHLGAAGAGTGGTSVMGCVIATTGVISLGRDINVFVRSPTSEFTFVSGAQIHENTQTNAMTPAAINLAADWELCITGQTATSGETIQLEAASVEIITP